MASSRRVWIRWSALAGGLLLAGIAVATTATSEPGDPAHETGEPSHAQQGSEAREFTRGTTTDGRQWQAFTYITKGGYPCVDVAVPGGELGSGTGGGCFAPEGGARQWGWVDVPGSPGEFVAFGQFRDVSDGGVVDVMFGTGARSVAVDEDGLFAVAGIGAPSAVVPAGH